MLDCEALAIYLIVGVILAWGAKRLITQVIEPKVAKARQHTSKWKVREVVVNMISNTIGGVGAKLTLIVLAEAGVIGSSSPLQGSRPILERLASARSAHDTTSR